MLSNYLYIGMVTIHWYALQLCCNMLEGHLYIGNTWASSLCTENVLGRSLYIEYVLEYVVLYWQALYALGRLITLVYVVPMYPVTNHILIT